MQILVFPHFFERNVIFSTKNTQKVTKIVTINGFGVFFPQKKLLDDSCLCYFMLLYNCFMLN